MTVLGEQICEVLFLWCQKQPFNFKILNFYAAWASSFVGWGVLFLGNLKVHLSSPIIISFKKSRYFNSLATRCEEISFFPLASHFVHDFGVDFLLVSTFLNFRSLFNINTFAASYLNTQGLNNSCLKSPASTSVDLTFQSCALRSFSLNQLRNLSL